MKIILVNKFWYLKGGAERVVFDTKKLLEDAGHSVEIFGLKDKRNIFENEYFINGVDYHQKQKGSAWQLAQDFIYNRAAKEKFAQLIKDFNPDVIHFHNIYHQLSFSLVDAAAQAKIPMVMTLHDYKIISPNYNLFHHGKNQEECLGGKYYNCVLKNCLENPAWSLLATFEAYWREYKKYSSKISYFISPSEFVKNKFIQSGFKEPIEVLPNLVEKGKSDTNYLGDQVLFFGRLSKEKGVITLLQAAKLLPGVKFKIAGAGPEEHRLKIFAYKNDLKNVEFLGFLGKERLQAAVNNARLVVVPSLWPEVFGLSIYEAVAAGKVVLGANIGAIPEALPADLLFTPNNPEDLAKTLKIWYNKPFRELQDKVNELNNNLAKISNKEHYLQQLINIYGKAIAKK